MASSDLIRLMVSDSGKDGLASSPGSGFVATEDQEYPQCVQPEPAEGNIEYKLKLLNPSASRLIHLVTQMKWRLREGQGEAIYEIGVEDSGTLAGLVKEDLEQSLHTLEKMAAQLRASTTVLRRCQVETESATSEVRFVAEVLVRKMPDDNHVLPTRVAVLGGVTAGKSTLLGVLSRGELDNGRGSARLNLLRHRHEVASGHTSSIGHEILGFDKCGEVVNYEASTAEDFCDHAAKLISFVDLAGHQKYQRTTMFGLSCSQPEYAMLVISASKGIVNITREHIGLAMALHVRLFVVVTKTDTCCSAMCKRTIQTLTRVLSMPGSKRTVVHVTTETDSIQAATNITSGVIVPVFTVSCVTGSKLDILKHFLNLLPARLSVEEQSKLEEGLAEFQVEDTYKVSGVGCVVGGFLTQGVMRVGDEVLLGPGQDGSFRNVKVHDLRRNRLPCNMIRAGQVATIALPNIERSAVRHGEVLLGVGTDVGSVCWKFKASIYPLSQPDAIQCHRQVLICMGAVRQGAVVQNMDGDGGLTFGAGCQVEFQFVRNAEFVRTGSRFIVCCGRCKALGEVSSVTAMSQDQQVTTSS